MKTVHPMLRLVAVLLLGTAALPYARPLACGMNHQMPMDHVAEAAWVAPGAHGMTTCHGMAGCVPAAVAPISTHWDGRLIAVITPAPQRPVIAPVAAPAPARASPPPRA